MQYFTPDSCRVLKVTLCMIILKNTVESRFTSKLQGTSYNPRLTCWKKNPPFLRFRNVALESVSIDCVDNPNTGRGQEGNFLGGGGGYSPAIPIRVCGPTGLVELLIVRVFS